jgi:hypothetical protein
MSTLPSASRMLEEWYPRMFFMPAQRIPRPVYHDPRSRRRPGARRAIPIQLRPSLARTALERAPWIQCPLSSITRASVTREGHA